MLAHRMAFLLSENCGQTVGYQIRHEQKLSPKSQIIVMTEGVLIRRLQNDPFLEGVNTIILDEFHERSIQLDLLLLFLMDVQAANDSLKIILTSATLETNALKAHFPSAYHAKIKAESFPIHITYLHQPSTRNAPEVAVHCLKNLLKDNLEGHVLIFMPGRSEINHCMDMIQQITDLPVFPLHGTLDLKATQAALAPAPKPKIIVSTNIAESSVTIPNVRYVIDSGLERVAIATDDGSQLQTQTVTLASAQQRAGRAGRTSEGQVYRLWTQPAENQFCAHREAEILRADLMYPLLQVYLWGANPMECAWLTAPPKGRMSKTIQELEQLGLVLKGRITTLGRKVAELPLQPRLALFLLMSHTEQCHQTACAFAAFVSEGDPWPKNKNQPVWEKILRVQADKKSRNTQAHKVYKQLLSVLPSQPQRSNIDVEATLAELYLKIFPTRLGRRIGLQNIKLANGQNGKVAENIDRESQYFIALSISQKDNRPPYVHQYLPVETSWIPTTKQFTHNYHSEREQVVAQSQDRIGALVIHSQACAVQPEIAGQILFQCAKVRPQHFLNMDKACQSWLSRLQYWAHFQADDIDCFEDLTDCLKEWCIGKSRRSELLQIPVLSELKSRTPWHIQQALDTDVPQTYTLPSGTKTPIKYAKGMPPQISARIQQLFGLSKSPLILGVPMQITLLAPNQRPQQQTQDMESFWAMTYPELRKELRGRYPKHAWPEHPTIEDAQNHPKRKR